MPRVLITGGAGNLGRLAAALFAERGYEVSLFDRFRPEEAPYPWQTEHTAYTGELWDGEAVGRAFDAVRADVVVHLGANPLASDHPERKPFGIYTHYSAVPRDDTMKSNVLGTYYVLDNAARTGVRRIVGASSFFVLGLGNRISGTPFIPDYLPMDEGHPNRPEDTYSLSKLLNEEMYDAYARAYGITIVALRFLGVYYRHSPEQPGRFRESPRPPADPRGLENVWMYADGRDAAHAILLAAEAEGLGPFEAFFIATGRAIKDSPKRWLMEHYPALAVKAQSLGEWDDMISIAKARRLLGYEPRHFWLDEYPEMMAAE